MSGAWSLVNNYVSLVLFYYRVWYSPWKVPNGNGASDNKLLTGEYELGRPDQSNQMNPPEMFRQTLGDVLNTQETFGIIGRRSSWTETTGMLTRTIKPHHHHHHHHHLDVPFPELILCWAAASQQHMVNNQLIVTFTRFTSISRLILDLMAQRLACRAEDREVPGSSLTQD